VAGTLGVGRAALSNAKRRNSISFLDELVEFCDREKLSLDFIRRGPPVSKEGITSAPAVIPSGQDERYVAVSVYSCAGAAPEEIDTVVIPREVHGEGSIVIRVNGDSMEKLFMSGSSAVVDTNSREIISGCVYAVRVPREGCIIRECISEPGGLSLIPYNKNYPASSIKWDDFDPGIIIGKVSCSVINVFR
jgi:Peptidase S24-like